MVDGRDQEEETAPGGGYSAKAEGLQSDGGTGDGDGGSGSGDGDGHENRKSKGRVSSLGNGRHHRLSDACTHRKNIRRRTERRVSCTHHSQGRRFGLRPPRETAS